MITAKVTCCKKQTPGGAGEGSTTLSFAPDYADGRNAEWAKYTPSLSLTMTVKGEVGDRFEAGKPYTLQFVESTD